MNKESIEKAKSQKLTYLGKSDKKRHHLFQFDECGHKQDIRGDKISTGNFHCSTCFENKNLIDYQSQGLTLIESYKNKQSLFKINKCNHEQIIRNDHAKKSNFFCYTCDIEKHKQEAKEKNVTILDINPIRRSSYLYLLNECGHTKIISRTNLRKGSFQCQKCESTYLTKPTNIYLLQITDKVSGHSWLKLGVAKNTDTRISGYGLKNSCETKTIKEIPFDTYLEAIKIEKKIHSKYHTKKLNKELMKKYLQRSGNTECYDNNMLQILLKSLDSHITQNNKNKAA